MVVVYGIIVALVGKRSPGTWLGEAILVALIFYGIWIMPSASARLTGRRTPSTLPGYPFEEGIRCVVM